MNDDYHLPRETARVAGQRWVEEHNEDKAERARRHQRSESFEKTLFGRFLGGDIGLRDIEQIVIQRAYPETYPFFQLPPGYLHCGFELDLRKIDDLTDDDIRDLLEHPPKGIIDPQRCHLEAIEVVKLFLEGDHNFCFSGSPLKPAFGLFFYGKPGTGKSHIMYGFARAVKEKLDERLSQWRRMLHERITRDLKRCQHVDARSRRQGGIDITLVNEISEEVNRLSTKGSGEGQTLWQQALTSTEKVDVEVAMSQDPNEVLEKAIVDAAKDLLRLPDQPSDIMCITFDRLYEVMRDRESCTEIYSALQQARCVFVDDFHDRGRLEQYDAFWTLVNAREDAGRRGAFVTSNICPTSIGGDKQADLKGRLLSRVEGAFYPICFDEAADFRVKVHKRLVSKARAVVELRLGKS